MNQGPPYAAVVFDCDSTLSSIEGIDELARQAGLYEQLAPLTHAAMDGSLPLQDVYRQRLDAIRPPWEAVAAVGESYIRHVVQGAAETVAALQARGKRVHIVSGGLRQALWPLAAFLGIPPGNVHAVDVYFDGEGRYQGFDEASPLARNGGKTEVCRQLRDQEGALLLVGDGITDCEAMASGADFIGFGGVVQREAVRQSAPLYIDNPDLQTLLPHLLTAEEYARPR